MQVGLVVGFDSGDPVVEAVAVQAGEDLGEPGDVAGEGVQVRAAFPSPKGADPLVVVQGVRVLEDPAGQVAGFGRAAAGPVRTGTGLRTPEPAAGTRRWRLRPCRSLPFRRGRRVGLAGQRGHCSGHFGEAGTDIGRRGADLAAAVGVAGVGAGDGIPEIPPFDPGQDGVPDPVPLEYSVGGLIWGFQLRSWRPAWHHRG